VLANCCRSVLQEQQRQQQQDCHGVGRLCDSDS
jgi:hypothetical protein